MAAPVVLRDLLRDRHWQTYSKFCREYDNAARKVDSDYVGRHPSRAQLHRWLMGDVKGLPFPQHCEVLEAMFPGLTVAEMFEPSQRRSPVAEGRDPLAEAVESGLDDANDDAASTWSELRSPRPTGSTILSVPAQQLDDPSTSGALTSSLQRLGRRLRLTDAELSGLAELAGHLIDLDLECTISIDADGWAEIAYRFVLLNLTDAPVRRLLREQWFENTEGIRIEPHSDDERRVTIQRLHDIGNMTKFACVVSPPIQPGEVGTIAYTTHGGRFLHDHFWQQSTPRHTRHLTLSISHDAVEMLVNCTATADRADGVQVSAIDDLLCDDRNGRAEITLTRDFLTPGESVTVRWEVARASA